MPHVLPQPIPTGAKIDDVNAKESDIPLDDTNHRRKSLLRGIQRLGHRKRREDEGRAPDQQDIAEEVKEESQIPIGIDGPVRRRSLLRRFPTKWRGKSEPSRARGHRRLKSEERPITPALVPQLEVNTKRRALSETRRAVVQNSRESSTTRQSSATRPSLNGRSSIPHDLRDVQNQFKRFKLDDTAEAAEPPEDNHLSQQPNMPSRFERVPDDPVVIPVVVNVEAQESVLDSDTETIDREKLSEELDSKWILNLSMQFRDESRQEKLFITYAERPNFWRRVTVTWDYRNVRFGSMEEDVRSLSLQRDKNMRVYESVRVSLPDIKFFDTVTNLKLKTEDDDRLHIYVAEDQDEIIEYPSIGLAGHIKCPIYTESEVLIEAHLSGFVYKVRANDEVCVKKEIPGPNNVDEFLYELNALDMLQNADSVIGFRGIVTDDEKKLIKGLLIFHAAKGSLVEMIYDFRHSPMLSWPRRRKWAGQIIHGLSAIHEAGYIQGDFTLSNIVVDEDDNAHIIDLNRRGCPVGWESPELMRLVLSKQKIGMMISTKTDLYQLGMVLFALAEQIEEPDRLNRQELEVIRNPEVPMWFRNIVRSCLEYWPQNRRSASYLLRMFEDGVRNEPIAPESDGSDGSEPADPEHVVTHDDIQQHRETQRQQNAPTQEARQSHVSGPNSSYSYTPSGEPVWLNNRTRVRGRSSARSLTASSHTSVSAEYITPAQEDPPPALIELADEPSNILSQKSSTVPPPSEERRSASKISDDRSSFRPQHARIPEFGHLNHQDSGLADIDTDTRPLAFRAPAHQDSGFDDFMTFGTEDYDRFRQPEQRDDRQNDTRHMNTGAAGSASSAHDSAIAAARTAYTK
ncbi:hypothetical protein B9Z65_4051 [Elsinoe australis]|uniref:Protein kinase domain-containing protein n=1 Tax=Elsinoe australis TaxID=40998 RepID=A0A2P7Z1P4_9PEZI|nr:hypothetical protein B9Z65_4051 [Elsinoe australis]